MKRPDDYDQMLKAVRGELSGPESAEFQQFLADNAEGLSRYEEETALERALDRLPDAPVSSNFTSLVMQEIRRETPSRGGRWKLSWQRFKIIPAATSILLLAALGLLAGNRYQEAQRAEMARGVTAFSQVSSALGSEETPPVEIFTHFDAIQTLTHMPAESELDMELLVALQR